MAKPSPRHQVSPILIFDHIAATKVWAEGPKYRIDQCPQGDPLNEMTYWTYHTI